MTSLAIYKISRPKGGGTIEHDAILRETDHGWELIEMHPEHGLRVRSWHSGPAEEGFDLGNGVACHNLAETNARLDHVLALRPLYVLFGFNCQHFTSFIMTGNRRSRAVDDFVSASRIVITACVVGLAAKTILRSMLA